MAFGLALSSANLFAEANYVYHERTTNNPGCGGQYVTRLNPTSAETYPLRFKVEYQFYTDTARVYYTTDGSTPSGAFGVPSGTTAVIPATYVCTFGGPVVDALEATIPAQPAGTVVKYIISAWHSGGGLEIFANGPGTPCGCGTPTSSSSMATVFQYTVGSTTNLYWDVNGPIAGAGGATPAGNWDSTATNWSITVDGTSAGTTWVSGRTAVFSAGTNATGAFTVNVSGTQTAANLVVEEGEVVLATGTVALGTGNLTIQSGATLTTDSSARMTASAGATATVNGGKLKTTNPGVAGTFINTNIIVTLGAAGGTFEHVTTNILNIVQEVGGSTNGVGVTGPGGLTKEGIGVLAVACAMNYAGPTIINNGELRMRTSPNRLPTNTALIVNSAGILNLNNINTTVGSLAGSGRVGFGTGTLFINQDTDTVFTGQLLRVANYGAGGVTSGSGRISKSGSGSLTLAGTNDLTGSITNFAGAINVPPGAVLCDPILDLYIHGGTLNMSNAQQIVLSLRGTNDGVVNLGPGHTLIVSNSSSATFVGSITGPGNLVKTNTGTWALMGNNTFDGNFFIRSGVLIASNATSLGSSAGFTEVAASGELRYDGVGSAFTVNEPIRIAGGGVSGGGAITIQNSASPTFSGPITLISNAYISVSSSASGVFTHPASITSLSGQNLFLAGGANPSGVKAITGTINLGTGGLTKTNSGEWILGGANLYTGPTTILQGSLRVTNTAGSATGNSTVTVNSGASLTGNGIIAGPVTVNGSISPGPVGIATLTINNNLTLAGTTAIELNKSAPQTSDRIAGINTLTAGGTLNVTNLGPALAAGDTFTVLLASTYTGGFTAISPSPGAGLAWDLPYLNTTGILRVHANPIPGTNVAEVTQGTTTTIPLAKLLANATGEMGETLSITAVTSPTSGGGTASLGGGFITYTAPASGTSDTISYTLNDGRGGTATGTIAVTLVPSNSQGFNQLALPENIGPNTWRLSYLGIPGYQYALDWRTNLTLGSWVPVETNTAGTNGLLLFTNVSAETANFYRTRYVP